MRDRSGRGWWLDSFLLFSLTAFLIWPWFRIEYLENWASIESTFIADGRMLRENLPHPGWQPLWYLGTRFDYIYPPMLRYGTAVLSKWLDVSTARSYHLYTGFFYCLGIVAVYLFSRIGMKSRGWAFVTAMAAGVASPAYLFFADIRADTSLVRNMVMRLNVLVRYGEGPHMSALAVLPLVFAAAWYGLRGGHPRWLAAGAIAAAATVSNNFYGATALALFFPVLAWALSITGGGWRVWLRGAWLAALAFGLTAFWLTPSYLKYTLRNMALVSHPGHAWSWAMEGAVLAVFGAVTWRLARNRPERAWTVFAIGALLRIALWVLGNHYIDFRTIGEPGRLIPEFDWAFLVAAATLSAWLWRRGCLGRLIVVAAMWWTIVACKGWVRRSWEYIPDAEGYQHRIEYKMTKWLHDNIPHERIFAVGSVRFWYNAWFDLSEVGGGSEQGTLNLTSTESYYEIAGGTNAETAILWLKAVGAGAALVHGKNSEEIYHDYQAPEKFQGKLEAIYEDGKDNWVYRVPRKFPGLARIVKSDLVRALRPLSSRIETEGLSAYVNAVETESPRAAEWKHEGPDRMRVRARLEPGEMLLIQESHDPAWRATLDGGRQVEIRPDILGFMLLDPGPGDHTIVLDFVTPLENQVGRGVTAVTGLIVLAMLSRRSRV